ncbi:hypothetical protein PGQ11_015619 [Apiospora arundinis]|uniref:Uncharacterized protein n=1 Tax=Apiospora arundinis TaxID=335852 RepID=A0ABR2HM23_9PEZI
MAPDEMPWLTSVAFDLPKLHPRYETPERHFMPGSSPPPPASVEIHRRQRHFRFGMEEEGPDGPRIRIMNSADFPTYYDVCGGLVTEEEPSWLGRSTLQEMEDWERECWEKGQDPGDVLDDLLGGPYICPEWVVL